MPLRLCKSAVAAINMHYVSVLPTTRTFLFACLPSTWSVCLFALLLVPRSLLHLLRFCLSESAARTLPARRLVCLRFLCSAWQIRKACSCFSAVSAVFIFTLIFIPVLFFALQLSLTLPQQQQ